MSEFNFSDLVFEDQIFIDFEVADKKELIEKISLFLETKGFVLPGYADQVLAREEEYPTGLPTNVMKVAIPHSIENDKIVKPSIVIARLKSPVEFNEMGSFENKVMVDFVVLLAVKGDKSQLVILPKLIGIFSDEPSMILLRDAKSSKMLYLVVKEMIAS